MPVTKCAQKLSTASQGLVSTQEAERILKELTRRAQGEAQGMDLSQALLKKAAEMREEWTFEQRHKEFKAYLNFAKRTERMAEIRNAKNPVNALEGLAMGTMEAREYAGKSADARSKTISAQHLSSMVKGLESRGLLDAFVSEKHADDIAREIANLNMKNPVAGPVTGNEIAHNAALVVQAVQRQAMERANQAGAGIRPYEGYIAKTSHDPALMVKAGFENWKEVTKKLLDDRTFEGVADKDKFMMDVFEGLRTGVHLKFSPTGEDALTAFKGRPSIYRKLGQERLLHFKDADSWLTYNKQFGLKNFRDTIVSQLNTVGHMTGLMEQFGPDWEMNYRKMWSDTVAETKRRSEKGDPSAKKHMDDVRLKDKDHSEMIIKVMSGSQNHPADINMARIWAGARSLQTLAKMGSSTLSSMGDIASTISELRYQGMSWGDAINAGWKEVTSSITAKQRSEFAEHLLVDLEGSSAEFSRQIFSQDNLPGVMSNLTRLMMKLNLQTQWNNAMKSGTVRATSWLMAKNADTAFDGLDELYRLFLSRYGIKSQEWDLVRNHMIFDADGRKYVGPSMVSNISDETLKATYGDLTPWQIMQKRRDIMTAVQMLFYDRANVAVPTPGAREHLFMLRDSRPGTAQGEFLRTAMQFKSFPITHVMKVWGRETIGRVPGGVDSSNFFSGMRQGLGEQWRTAVPGMLGMITSMTLMGYLAMTAKDMTKGIVPRDPRDPRSWGAAFMQGGGAGIMGDFVFGEYNRYGRDLTSTLAGPTFGELNTVSKVWASFIRGEDAGAQALSFAIKNSPGSSLFYLRPAINYLLLYQLQEAVNPGSLRRMERRIERDQGQTFMVPPSSLY